MIVQRIVFMNETLSELRVNKVEILLRGYIKVNFTKCGNAM